MPSSLPTAPNLEQLRKQATDLLKAHHRGDVSACRSLRSLRRFAAASDPDILAADVALHDAQHAIALQYGMRSWRDLVTHVQDRAEQERLLREQYKNPSNLQARSGLHGRFQTNRYGWLRWVFDHFAFGPEARILDAGCGDAGLWRSERGRIGPGWRIRLIDQSAGMIEESRRRVADLPNDISLAVADVQAMPFADGTFDAVIANHMLYHVADLDRGLREIQRVLRPGGQLYATTGGLGSMGEVRDLVRPFAPDLPFVQCQTWKSFGLENGADYLGRYFERVRVDLYEDSLAVTETEPLLAYILSVRGASEMLSDAAVGQLRRLIDERIAADGVFRITKTHGMLMARRGDG